MDAPRAETELLNWRRPEYINPRDAGRHAGQRFFDLLFKQSWPELDLSLFDEDDQAEINEFMAGLMDALGGRVRAKFGVEKNGLNMALGFVIEWIPFVVG